MQQNNMQQKLYSRLIFCSSFNKYKSTTLECFLVILLPTAITAYYCKNGFLPTASAIVGFQSDIFVRSIEISKQSKVMQDQVQAQAQA